MKKLLLPLLVCFVFLMSANVAVGYDENGELNEGAHLGVKVAWVNSNYDIMELPDVTFDMWQATGDFKYQAPDEFYGRVRIIYSSGSEKDKENMYYKPKTWRLEGGIGWTFPFGVAGMVSPFIAAAYNNYRLVMKDKSSEKKWLCGKELTGKFYGIAAKVGVDIQYLLENNFAVGIIGMIGMPISNYYKEASIEKVKMKSKIFWEILVPVSYHFKNGKVGLELSYTHDKLRSREDLKRTCVIVNGAKTTKKADIKRNNFGIALVLGAVF